MRQQNNVENIGFFLSKRVNSCQFLKINRMKKTPLDLKVRFSFVRFREKKLSLLIGTPKNYGNLIDDKTA